MCVQNMHPKDGVTLREQRGGEALKSKNSVAQVNELLAEIIAYNLTVAIHEMYENGIQPELLHVK